MRRLLIVSLALGLLAATAQAAPPGDAAAGERLHAANCTGCHDTGVYTRKDRRIGSLEALNLQFETCAHMTKKTFTPSEVRDMTKFLNDRFYHFK
ncbi:MAG: hypothetical protein HYU78_17085 [Rhodocyclales bacterium]|nr:hypothetical protein [Rhodocyclales bacterium]